MNLDEWELEMNHMFDTFTHQAVFSLGKIKQRFEILGRPFDEKFRQNFLKMSNLRLDMSFDTVLISQASVRCNEAENTAYISDSIEKYSSNPLKIENDDGLIEICDSENDNHTDTRPSTGSTHDHMVMSPMENLVKNCINIQNADSMRHGTDFDYGNVNKPFIEAGSSRGNENSSDCAEMIEIYDSDDDGQQFRIQTMADLHGDQIEINENSGLLEHSLSNEHRNDTHIDIADMDSENEITSLAKVESNAVRVIETVNIPLIVFNPSKANADSAVVNGKGENSKTYRTGPTSNVVFKRQKHCGGKRFKCAHCQCTFQSKSKLKQHQRIHANGKLIGVKADSNGLYHCTLCVRQFTEVRHLSNHMRLHKDNQCLYYCSQCMCLFDQEADKDKHESHCEGRHYECHLCKVFVTTDKNKMQIHMRTHSGVRPFRCMVCNKFFKSKSNLARHLNGLHSRNIP